MSRHSVHIARGAAAHSPSRRAAAGFPMVPMARMLQLVFASGVLALAGWQADAHAQATPAAQAPRQAADAMRRYDIPAGPLSSVLARFANESGVLVAGAGALAQDKTSPGISGVLSVQAALEALLAGTGLEAVRDERGQYRLQAAPQNGVTTLSSVTVTADALRRATSEGTGSYAAKASSIGKTGTQSLRETPQSISVVTRQQMDDQSLLTVEDALEQVPGVYFGVKNAFYTEFSSRGYVMSVAQDGIPSSTEFFSLDDLSSIDRVEVIRGPAALLRGASSLGDLGGVVNIVRRRPKDEFAVSGVVSVGSWNNYSSSLDVTGPLNESGSVRGRGVVSGGSRDFFYDKAHQDRYQLYGIVEADLTPSTLVSLSAAYQNTRNKNPYDGLPRYADGSIISDDRSRNLALDGSHIKFSNVVLTAEIKHQFDSGWEAKATLSKRHYWEDFAGLMVAGTPDAATNTIGYVAGNHDSDYSTIGYDASLSGPFDLAGLTGKITVGVDGSHHKGGYGHNYQYFADQEIYNPTVTIGGPKTYYDRRIPQHSFYGVAQIKPVEPLTLIIGARVSNYKNESRTRSVASTTPWETDYDLTRKVTPYGGVIWDLNEQISLYASYTDVFIPQSAYSYPSNVLPPRVGWQAEVGVKGEFFDGRLNASLALYRMRDTNRPVLDPDHRGCGGTPTGNCYTASGLVQSQGIDFEMSGEVLPGLQIAGGYTYNANKYLVDADASNVGNVFDGRAPRHLFKLWGSYKFGAHAFGGALSKWRVGAGVLAQSKTAYDKIYKQGGYVVVNAMAEYQASSRTTIILNVNNLFDRRYFTILNDASNFYGEPRNVQVTLRHQF